MTKEFDDFIVKEMVKLKKKYPQARILKDVVIENDAEPEDSDIVDELNDEIPSPDDEDEDGVYDESKEFE